MVPCLVSASTACCRPRLPTLSAALQSNLQNHKGHEDLHVFMHDGKMRPNRSKFDRQAPTEKAVVGNFTEKKKDGLETSTAQTRARHSTSTGLLLQHQDYTDPLLVRVYMYVRGPHTHVRICCCLPISYVSKIRSPLKRS